MMMDTHEDADGRMVPGLTVYICEGCQEGYHLHCIWDCYGSAAEASDRGLSSASWTDPALDLVAHSSCSVWCCGDCVEGNRWGVRSLVESMLTFGTTQCSAKSATYSALTHFHADTTSPEACFVHGRVPLGADPHGNTKDAGLVDDLRRQQGRRLAGGGEPRSKLPRLSELQPMTGKNWYRPDMTAEHHAATAKHWLVRAPLSFCQETATRGRAGSRAAFADLAARAKQRRLFIEPCVRDPLMVAPLDQGPHPHFKLPQAQGWDLLRYANAVGWLEQTEVRRT